MSKKILIVEDEIAIQNILKNYLEDAGYDVTTADDGVDGFSKWQGGDFDLVLLDIMMPKIDGFGVLELIRKESNVPVAMITAMGDVVDQLRAFELQVDDYITKPFDMKLVLVRIAALLRRSEANSQLVKKEKNVIKYQNLIMDIDAFEVIEDDVKLYLTQKEFEILRVLLENQDRVYTREMLLSQLWGYDFFGNSRVVNVHIQNLRGKMSGDYIETVRGVGYKIAKAD